MLPKTPSFNLQLLLNFLQFLLSSCTTLVEAALDQCVGLISTSLCGMDSLPGKASCVSNPYTYSNGLSWKALCGTSSLSPPQLPVGNAIGSILTCCHFVLVPANYRCPRSGLRMSLAASSNDDEGLLIHYYGKSCSQKPPDSDSDKLGFTDLPLASALQFLITTMSSILIHCNLTIESHAPTVTLQDL